jgi:steroid delta-isomerase-like uncharacterized protein
MSALDAATRYFNAWNARDASAILATLSADATYDDPITGGPISGDAIARYAKGLWTAFPDLVFDMVSVAETGSGRVAAQWIMRGTNLGSFQGLPPTGKRVETTGADFVTTADGKVTSVTGYFDAGSVPRQLGLQVLVQPHAIGPFTFGTSVAAQTRNREVPGAFSVTQLQALDEAAAMRVSDVSRQIVMGMLTAPGFIGVMTATIGRRQVTLSAWSTPEAAAKFTREGTHATVMKPFFAGEIAESGFTSVWSPVRMNTYWVRCTSCRKMNDSRAAAGSCACGATLSDHPPYW